MKAMELCRKFFFEVGLPVIEKKIPECLPYLAAGLYGGSQCHGNDDETSRDHGWGPGFGIWLGAAEIDKFKNSLQEVLGNLPKEYLGYTWNLGANHACPVFEIGSYIKEWVGYDDAPTDEFTWLRISEEKLFEITHRPIFYDATGEVTRRFNAFSHYPEDIWKKRLATNLMDMWLWGVKYIKRSVQRGDLISSRLKWGRYAEYVMKVDFLLNHEYAPYDKWLYVQFSKLGKFGDEIGLLLRRGLDQSSELATLVTQIEQVYIRELMFLGFEPFDPPLPLGAYVAYPDNQLVKFAKGILNTIRSEEIKNFR